MTKYSYHSQLVSTASPSCSALHLSRSLDVTLKRRPLRSILQNARCADISALGVTILRFVVQRHDPHTCNRWKLDRMDDRGPEALPRAAKAIYTPFGPHRARSRRSALYWKTLRRGTACEWEPKLQLQDMGYASHYALARVEQN